MKKRPNRIFIDGRSAVYTGSGRVDAWQGYRQGYGVTTCLNTTLTEDVINASTSVFFNGCPAITVGSKTSHSQGDAHTQGGLLNGGLKGAPTTFRTGSNSVIIQGRQSVRAFDLCEPNQGNGPLVPVLQPGDASPHATAPAVPSLDREALAATHSLFFAQAKFEHLQKHNFYGMLETCPSGDDETRIQVHALNKGFLKDGSHLPLTQVIPKANAASDTTKETIETEWTFYLLEKDLAPGYTQTDVAQWPALKERWASSYPIPIGQVKVKASEEEAVSSKTETFDTAIEFIAIYPVCLVSEKETKDQTESQKNTNAKRSSDRYAILPNGWLYLFKDGHLWREVQVISRTPDGFATYLLRDVNLLTQQGLDKREATIQGRMEQLLLPIRIGCEEVSLGLAFSETQWTWEKILSLGGLATNRVRRHRARREKICVAVSESSAISTHQLSSPDIAILHTDPDSPLPEYEGPVLVCRSDLGHLAKSSVIDLVKTGVGFLVGAAEQFYESTTEVISEGIDFLKESEAIIDDPSLINADLLNRRASQREALIHASQHPAETADALWQGMKNQVGDGMEASQLAQSKGNYFESGRQAGKALAEPVAFVAGAGKFGGSLIKRAAKSALKKPHINQTSAVNPFKGKNINQTGKTWGNETLSQNTWQNFKNSHTRSTGVREITVSDISRAEELAETIYKEIRLNPNDIKIIAKNTGFNEVRIQRIKDHLFFKEHQLRYSVDRFDADPIIVVSWKRLESGTFTKRDLQLLNHELFESKFEEIFKTDYLTAHNAANRAGYFSPIEMLNPEEISEIYNGFLHRFR